MLLPDHLHAVWALPPNDADYPTRWRRIKRRFTQTWGRRRPVPEADDTRRKRKERAVWQRRLWEHRIRNERDFQSHFHYIHYNPVKHGLVKRVIDWPWSSFHRYLAEGVYDADWGVEEPAGARGSPNDHGSGTTAAKAPNEKPVADAGTDQTVASGSTVTLNGTFSSDADNDPLTYTWSQTGGPSVILSSNKVPTPTFNAPVVAQPTVLIFNLTVKDGTQNLERYSPGDSESDPDTVRITVEPTPE